MRVRLQQRKEKEKTHHNRHSHDRRSYTRSKPGADSLSSLTLGPTAFTWAAIAIGATETGADAMATYRAVASSYK